MAEEDWLFDYVLQFLESEKFDCVVMDFIDEKCEAFDNEEENRFEYTTIHREFKDMVETMISSNLGELGVTVDMFFDACQKGRNSRDINQAVIERMIAMDDFLTFKKIMVKRNMELQLEAMKAVALGGSRKRRGDGDEDEDLPMSAEDEAEMERIIHDSIMEMEMFHIQAEMEAIEMERVLAMSLALEEEKLNVLQTELEEYERDEAQKAKDYYNAEGKRFKESLRGSGSDEEEEEEDYERQKRGAGKGKGKGSDAKGGSGSDATVHESKYTAMPDSPISPERGAFNSPVVGRAKALDADAKPGTDDPPSALKPLKMKQEYKPLPSIHGSSSASASASASSGHANKKAQEQQVVAMAEELDAKRREVEKQFRLNQESQQRRKDQANQLKEKENSGGESESEMEARVRYMKEQRERILEKKKAERERKAQEEREVARKLSSDRAGSSPGGKERPFEQLSEAEKFEVLKRRAARQEKGMSDEELREKKDDEESKRAAMRQALAHRMKMDMLTSNMTGSGSGSGAAKTRKEQHEQNRQFSDLDAKLREMDQLRDDQDQESAKTIAGMRGNTSKKY